MTSNRLPGKVMKMVKGQPLIYYHLKRAADSGIPLIVATTVNKEDDILVESCKDMGVKYFRGDESDVLDRYYGCARENNLDVIIRITSDCPLIDRGLIKKGLDSFKQSKSDYLSNTVKRTFPRGFDFEVFTFEALKEAFLKATEPPEREHVTPYIWLNKENKFHIEQLFNDPDKSMYRVTVDTEPDFQLIKVLIEEFDAHLKDAAGIIKILDEHPELVQINKEVRQKAYGK